MINKIKHSVNSFFTQQSEILKLSKESDWANIYHDSIRGKDFLQELPLNIGRWAGSYSFFYVLNRILKDYKPKSILEFGLGESTKFIMAYLNNELSTTNHTVIEQDENWADIFAKNNILSENTNIVVCPLQKGFVYGFETNFYLKLNSMFDYFFDLYIIDGPFGSKRFSRYDIVYLANKFPSNHEFIILFDDFNRVGEKDTVSDLLKVLQKKDIKIYCSEYSGVKSLYVIGTEKFKYVATL